MSRRIIVHNHLPEHKTRDIVAQSKFDKAAKLIDKAKLEGASWKEIYEFLVANGFSENDAYEIARAQ